MTDVIEPAGDDGEPEACAFMSVLDHRCDPPEDVAELEDLVARIEVRGNEPYVEDDGTQIGPIVEVRFVGCESGKVVEVMMDANAALELADRLIRQYGVATGDEDDA